MDSKNVVRADGAPSAKPKESPPWKIACLRWMKPTTSFEAVYRLMGWTAGIRTTRCRFPDMRISEAAKLADVLGAPRGAFLATVAEATIGDPPPRRGSLALVQARALEEVEHRGPGRPPLARKAIEGSAEAKRLRVLLRQRGE